MRNLTTTSTGCAFFAFVPPATYTVSLGAVGYVDRQGGPTASQVTGVTSGTTSSVAFDYDQAATLTLTPDTARRWFVPVEPAHLRREHRPLPTGSKAFAGTGAIRTIGNLFPYEDGYAAWAGDCADADPEGKDGSGVAFWDGATRDTAFETAPGGTATGAVTMPTVEVRLREHLGVERNARHRRRARPRQRVSERAAVHGRRRSPVRAPRSSRCRTARGPSRSSPPRLTAGAGPTSPSTRG